MTDTDWSIVSKRGDPTRWARIYRGSRLEVQGHPLEASTFKWRAFVDGKNAGAFPKATIAKGHAMRVARRVSVTVR
jgi:hypothetical protein